MTDDPSLREKLEGIQLVAGYRPKFAAGIVVLNLVTALLEGLGLGLLLPIIETAQRGGDLANQTSGVTAYFFSVYELFGVPFALETLILGLAAVMTVRFGLSFLTTYLQISLRTEYIVHLREQCFDRFLAAEVSFVDEQDDDDIINTIITEISRSSGIIMQLLNVVEIVFFVVIYMAVAVLIAPTLTLTGVLVLGVAVFLTRYVIRPGYEIGDRVASANERIQRLVNAGIRGIREIKLFNMADAMAEQYRQTHETYAKKNVALGCNQAALSSFNQLLNALALFALVYIAIGYLELSFASLGVFLFAMFRLSPQISNLNNTLYTVDGDLPHLLRCHDLIDEFGAHAQPSGGREAPSPVDRVELNEVTFQYDDNEDATDVRNVSLAVERGETIALVGPSGAGKSTLVSLIARLYEPDAGQVRVNGVALTQVNVDSWHDRIAVVPQHPFVFNETLRYNVAIGKPDASDAEIRRACEIGQVTAFLDELPAGLDSQLGDDAVRLSGGQRQRIAIARALLTDADMLLLDEATSELDSPTEEAILEGIESMDREYLTVVVGHLLSTVRDADRIYTIADGEVVETGTHRELLANDSEYADLYGSQAEPTTRR